MSFSALPWISIASKPENFRKGPKKPPTLLSITEFVCGEILTTRDFPVPEYWVIPPIGPDEIMISFSGSSHFVSGFVASHSNLSPYPFPPINFSFITGGTAFSLTTLSPAFIYRILSV